MSLFQARRQVKGGTLVRKKILVDNDIPRSTCATPPAAPANRSLRVLAKLPVSAASRFSMSISIPFQLSRTIDLGDDDDDDDGAYEV